MPCVEVNQSIGSFTIPPCHAIDDARPYEGYSRFSHYRLLETSFHKPICHVRVNLDGHETVRECQIAIEAWLKAAHPINLQISIKNLYIASQPGYASSTCSIVAMNIF